jgi:hypothetical protein
MGRRTWTTLMDERLRSLYGIKPTKELAREFGVSELAIWKRAGRMGLTSGMCGYSGDWYPDELDILRATYPILGQDCAPLCNHSRAQTGSRAQYMKVHRTYRKEPEPNRGRRKYALMAARWCVTHGVSTERTLEACAEAAGCTPQMMRLVLPALLEDERKRRKG